MFLAVITIGFFIKILFLGESNLVNLVKVKFELNISDFNVQGQAFGDQELYAAIERGAIQILDDATIAAMKERRAQKREAERLAREAEAAANPTPQDPNADWEAALKEWNDYYGEAEK